MHKEESSRSEIENAWETPTKTNKQNVAWMDYSLGGEGGGGDDDLIGVQKRQQIGDTFY